MRKLPTSLLVGVFLATLLVNMSAWALGQVIMQHSSEPGEAGELFVFVGEQVSYQSSDFDCGEGCWVFDSWYKARYRVAKRIFGFPPGDELEFNVAEHAARFPFGHTRYALVIIERNRDSFDLVKYQQVPVYPTVDGDFASCGPRGGIPANFDEPLDPDAPPLRDVDFSPPLLVDHIGRLSPYGRQRAYDPRWHRVEGDDVICHRGVPLSELVPHLVSNHDMLSAELPHLLEAPQ